MGVGRGGASVATASAYWHWERVYIPSLCEVVRGYEDCRKLYPLSSKSEVTLLGNHDKLRDSEARFFLWCIPGSLPSLLDNKDLEGYFLEQQVMVYSPHRVAHQLGFDQGVPHLLSITKSFESYCQIFSSSDFKNIHHTKRQLFFPSMECHYKAFPG